MIDKLNYELEYMQQQLSSVWPDWRVTKKLGKGSYGSVYEIVRDDLAVRYTCALKVLHMEAQDSDTFEITDFTVPVDRISDREIDEFLQSVSSEIELMVQLKGVPNIVTIEDYAILRNPRGCTILIRMEELEPLESYLRRRGGAPDKEELIRLGTDICNALSFCEQKNILHRDIKASNLFYSEKAGFKLGDFGISRTMASIREKSSMSGIGTPRYIAPEIYQGRKYNNTADIYSLGLVLYFLANGFTPPLCDDASGSASGSPSTSQLHDANMRRLRGEPLPPPRYADEMLASVICTACAPAPERRFQTADAFRNALLTCLHSSPSAPGKTSGKHTPALLYGLIAAAAVLILLSWMILRGRNHTRSGADNTPSAENTQLQPEASAVTEADGSVLSQSGAETQDDSAVADGFAAWDIPASENTDADSDSGAPIQWSDPNLRDAVVPQVQAALSISRDLTIADARKIQALDLTDAGISDITSLQYFTGLNNLCLCNNFVSDISALSDLKKLQDLNLEKNLVRDLRPLSGLVRLTRLDLYLNEIEDISPLAALTQLNMLDIRSNRVSDLSALKNMRLMEKLYLSENQDLYDLSPLSDMPALHYLSVKRTSVAQISPLKNNTNLSSLIISWTNVSDISLVDSFPELSYLDVRNCPIKDYGPAKRADARKGTKVDR